MIYSGSREREREKKEREKEKKVDTFLICNVDFIF